LEPVSRGGCKCGKSYQALFLGAKEIVIKCLPPNMKYPLKCRIVAVQIQVSIGSEGEPISIPVVLSSANQILED
jgi:hypothetical protein